MSGHCPACDSLREWHDAGRFTDEWRAALCACGHVEERHTNVGCMDCACAYHRPPVPKETR